MKTKKNDFIEIEFVGKNKDTGEVFDTNIKKEAEKINLNIEAKPLIVCIGQGMLVKGFDSSLENKEAGKKYKVSLSPEESFGKRHPGLVKIIPLKVFKDKNFNPAPGMIVSLDNSIVKIITVSGGRVIVDFNNPLAGKEIEYEFTINKKIQDDKEKVNSLQDFFFKKRFPFSIKDKKILFNKEAEPFLKIFESKFKELLKKDLDISSITHIKQK
tara:strand:+ start:730 stop:1371 length:642 start_codon:yes stop_codon:yes gene_type:complete